MTSKDQKKLTKLKERLTLLETELTTSLIKKSSVVEIDVSKYTRDIQELKK